MRRRRLLVAFVVYVTIDLANPFVPGAFTFNPDECVEGIHGTSSQLQRADASAVPARVPVARVELPPPSPVRPLAGGRHAIVEWLVDSRHDTRVAGDPPPPSEDH